MVLKTLQKIQLAVERRPREIDAAKKDGQKVLGWIGYTMPEEIIHASGMIPLRLGKGGDDRLVEIGSRYISTQNCAFIRASAGLFAENKDPYVQKTDAVAFDTTCMQVYRLGEVTKYYFKKKTFFLGVPRNFQTPQAREYFFREVEAFTRQLEEFSGKKITGSALAASTGLYNNIREAIKKLYAYAAHDSPQIITWHDVYQVVHAGYYLDRQEYLALLQNLVREIGELRGTGEAGKPSKGVRILLSGSVIAPGDTKLIDIVTQLKGNIVTDDLWSGLDPYLKVDIREPSLKGIADAYMDRILPPAIPHLDQSTDIRLQNLKRAVTESSADGVIYHSLRYCDSVTFKGIEMKDFLNNEGIPFLEIHTEYAKSDMEAIRTRSEAFIEMVKFRKRAGGKV
ncbi:2-hydroxyacyl-CoA dehydratase subunit D [Methanoregula sp.]|uniref:2-hydroxyacyl-CoA dehydratase subunit D n=1 Tax=Methanoregula sp. TaxID=2052170 RepID=UPI003C758DEC